MDVHLASCCLLMLSCGAVWANVTNPEPTINTKQITYTKRSLTNVDLLAEALKERLWQEEDSPCLDVMLQGLNDNKNLSLWAAWMLDAMHMPVGQLYGSTYHVGNYDECMNPPWLHTHPKYLTQYCVAKVDLATSTKTSNVNIFNPEEPSEKYIETLTKHGRNIAKMYWSICVPAVCRRAAILNIYKSLLQISHLNSFTGKSSFEIASCEVAGSAKDYPTGYYVFILTLAFLFLFACWCSYYIKKYYDPNATSYTQEIIRSFYFKRNIDSLTNVRDDEIYSMNVIRLTSSYLIIYGHLIFLVIGRMVINGLKVELDLDSSAEFFVHGDTIVDTFFALSGLLLIRGFIKASWTNPIKFLVKRYMRLIGGLALLTYYQKYVFYYIGDGPFWEMYARKEKEICEARLWDNLAMISNYWAATTLACYPIGWSICADFQLSIMAVITCCIYRKNKRYGIFTFVVLFGLSTFATGLIQYINNIPAAHFYGIESTAVPRTNIVLTTTYKKTHVRADAFMIGMAMGYVISLYNPAKYKRIISKKWSYLMLIGCLALMGGIGNLGYLMYLHPDRLNKAIFAATNRNIWALCIVTIISICEYGDLGLEQFFKWTPFMPLSRLTYGVYIIHVAMLERYIYSSRTPYKWDMLQMLVETTGIMAIALVLSFLLWLIIEGPLVNLTSLFVDGIKLKKPVTSAPIPVNSVLRNNSTEEKKKRG